MGNWFSNNFNESFPISIRNKDNYGWKPDIPDQRDKYVSFPVISKFHSLIDLRKELPLPLDQGDTQSCVACALVSAYEYEHNRTEESVFTGSVLFLYYNQRVIDNSVEFDNGGGVRDCIKVINKLGICSEKDWPITMGLTNRPTIKAYLEAQKFKAVKYKRVKKDIISLRSALMLKYPIVFGFTVYESFYQTEFSGQMPSPKPTEKVLGTHCALICGYCNEDETFLVRNSFGETWGDSGYFTMSYDFVLGLSCLDFWVIEKIKRPEDTRSMVDIVRGYQIRETIYESDSDSELEDCEVKGMKKSESKVSIVNV